MQKITKYILAIGLALALLLLIYVQTHSLKLNSFNATIKHTQQKEPILNNATPMQTKGQVQLFKEALDELSATSPEQVIELWAKGEKTRNGVLQYAVASDALKNEIIEARGNACDNFWIIGGSSPWLDKYEIICKEKINDLSYKVTIKYYWLSSFGSPESSQVTLIIVKHEGNWYVQDIK